MPERQKVYFRSTGNNVPLLLTGLFQGLEITIICTKYPKSVQHTYLVDICDESKDRYRFGFNGQEKVNEIAGVGNFNEFSERGYDTRTAKFIRVDPLEKTFPWNSPYSFAENTPIQSLDLEGTERYHYTLAFDKKGKAATTLAYQEDIKDHVWVWKWFKSGWGKPEVNKRKEYVIHTGRFHTGAVNRSAYSQEITFTFDNIADHDKKVRSVTERDINRIDRNMSLGDRFATGLQNVGDESGRGVGLGALRAKTTRSGS